MVKCLECNRDLIEKKFLIVEEAGTPLPETVLSCPRCGRIWFLDDGMRYAEIERKLNK